MYSNSKHKTLLDNKYHFDDAEKKISKCIANALVKCIKTKPFSAYF